MRPIVVGESYPQDNSTTLLQAWWRFPAKAGREAFYKTAQANSQPQAPGDYAGLDQQEPADLQAGRWVEVLAQTDECRLDPSDSTVVKEQKISRAYALASARFSAKEDARLALWGTFSPDGTAWTIKSA